MVTGGELFRNKGSATIRFRNYRLSLSLAEASIPWYPRIIPLWPPSFHHLMGLQSLPLPYLKCGLEWTIWPSPGATN